jgi:hypothetical protein
VSGPPSLPPSARPRDESVIPGFEFDRHPRATDPFGPAPHGREPAWRDDDDVFAGEYSLPASPASTQTRPIRVLPPGPPRPGPAGPRAGARREWTRLLRSFVPEPVKRHWFSEFRSALHFRGLGVRVAIPIMTMIIFGIAVVVIADANSGHSGPAPPPSSLGFPPATLAGNQFTAAASGRGISQTLGRVTSDGSEIVAVGSQVGARIARAQFFVSLNDGRSWAMGSVRAPGGGPPPPGYAASLVAGGRGAWVALGAGSIWTSIDGQTWTLSSTAGLPLRPGDQIDVLKRTATGFIAAGTNVPGGDQAKASPVVFRSANGITWQRLGASQLRLPAGRGRGIRYRVLDIRYAAAYRSRILIAGDVAVTGTTGPRGQAMTARTSAAWLSDDGGTTWALAVPPGGAVPAGHGARAQISGEAATSDGFVLVRPATAGGRPVVDVYRSPDGTAWTFAATLGTSAGFVADMTGGGPDGAAVTGHAGRILAAFSSADGASWRPVPAIGSTASQDTTGVAVAAGGVVVAAGTTTGDPDSRQPLITVLSPQSAAEHVDVATIPGAADPQLAVNGIAAANGRQVAVGSANGFPAAWTSADGGSSWTRAVGQPPAALNRPGIQQLTSVTFGPAGWLAVGGVTAVAAQHPVVVGSADGIVWQAADGEAAFSKPGLFTEQAAAGPEGYVIVGYQAISGRMTAAAWWSAGLAGWQRAGTLDASQGATQMMAVTAGPRGFVAVGAAGDQGAAWTSPDGRNWNQVSVPLPVGASRAVLQQVASNGRTVAAVGTALTTTGQQVPFAASSSDGGASWAESALPVPSGRAFVTALAATGRGFVAAGTFGSTPGHQDVVVWTSADGSAWKAVAPAGQGLAGPGIQAITALTASASTLTGVGFTASPAGEQPVFWQSPLR